MADCRAGSLTEVVRTPEKPLLVARAQAVAHEQWCGVDGAVAGPAASNAVQAQDVAVLRAHGVRLRFEAPELDQLGLQREQTASSGTNDDGARFERRPV